MSSNDSETPTPDAPAAATPDTYGDPDTRARILAAAWRLVPDQGAALRLADVARAAEVSRQAVYLHFGDKSGLLLALVQHMDATLDLEEHLGAVMGAADGAALVDALMRLNTTFWRQVRPVAEVLVRERDGDPALWGAWRDRMDFRLAVFTQMVERLDGLGELGSEWTAAEAAETLYGLAHFDTWRELVIDRGWSDDRYVETMTRVLSSAFLTGT